MMARSRSIRGMLILLLVAGATSAQENFDDAAAIEAAEKGLSQKSYPWYDSSKDELHRVEAVPKKLPPEANDWSVVSGKAKSWDMGTWNFNLGDFLARLLQIVAWILLAALFVFGIYWALRFLLDSEISLGTDVVDPVDDSVSEASRIERLPFDIRNPKSDLLAEARRQYEAGNYRDAIIYLFSYQLVQLDKNQWIRLNKGKTNRQYLIELRKQTDLRSLLRTTMVAFEDVFFGHHPIDRNRFESCWNRLDEFHELVRPGGAA